MSWSRCREAQSAAMVVARVTKWRFRFQSQHHENMFTHRYPVSGSLAGWFFDRAH